jgi:predicted RNA-binding Zn-ribbon protein involved in translation (DUF1610 family)
MFANPQVREMLRVMFDARRPFRHDPISSDQTFYIRTMIHAARSIPETVGIGTVIRTEVHVTNRPTFEVECPDCGGNGVIQSQTGRESYPIVPCPRCVDGQITVVERLRSMTSSNVCEALNDRPTCP